MERKMQITSVVLLKLVYFSTSFPKTAKNNTSGVPKIP